MAKRVKSKGNSAAAAKSVAKKVQALWAKKFALEQERIALESDHVRAIGRLYERLAEVDAELGEQVLLRERLTPVGVKRGPGRPPGSVSLKKGRRAGGKRSPRGQNLSKVTEFLKSQSSGATQADIARKTGINPAIISLLVKRHADQFRKDKGRGGLIRLGR